jgi:hypothetical protein
MLEMSRQPSQTQIIDDVGFAYTCSATKAVVCQSEPTNTPKRNSVQYRSKQAASSTIFCNISQTSH